MLERNVRIWDAQAKDFCGKKVLNLEFVTHLPSPALRDPSIQWYTIAVDVDFGVGVDATSNVVHVVVVHVDVVTFASLIYATSSSSVRERHRQLEKRLGTNWTVFDGWCGSAVTLAAWFTGMLV